MKRMPSLFTRILPLAMIGVLAAAPALAQTTPPPSAVAPTALPPGRVLSGPTPEPGQSPRAAQATTPPAAAPRPEAPRAPSILSPNNTPLPSATNIRLDLVITDTYTGAPVKKTVSLMVLTGNNGMIRTNGSDGFSVLNVDAIAAAYTGGLVSIRMTFEYTPAQVKQDTGAGRAPRLNESITVVVQDGKPMMVSQSADPATDRKVTTELTATILK